MKSINTTEAVGHVLCHDLTRIIKGETKNVVFKKGHIVREEDIPVLLSIGKEHLYVWEKEEGMLHENDAAQILYTICKGENMSPTAVKEGKIELIADCDGVLKIDTERLKQINALGEMMIASRHNNVPVKKGDKLAGTRVIPLMIHEDKMNAAIKIGWDKPLLEIMPFYHKKVGIVTTGSEVFLGRIEDAFTPVIIKKLSEYDTEVVGHRILGDDHEKITQAIRELIAEGADLVVCTGGMSVDPDDRTPLAIKNTGAEIITYGAPVLPGAMFLLAYYEENIPIMGLPGCVMYAKRTIFDLILPRVLVDERLSKDDFSVLGVGGLCLSCPVCIYPNCGFGKGM